MASAVVIAMTATPAAARSLEDSLTGKLALGADALPKRTDRAYGKSFRKRAAGRAVFQQNPASGAWKIHYATVSKRPVRDATITLIDVSHGRKLVGTRETILYSASRVVQGSLTLSKREVIDPNSRLLMIVESGGRVLARRALYIQGKAPRRPKHKRNKTIDFTEETRQARSPAISIETVRNRRR
jgi:hypothetical protein